MVAPPRHVAYLAGIEPMHSMLVFGFQRDQFPITPFDAPATLLSQVERGLRPDCVIIPLTLGSGGSGISACFELRSAAPLRDVPIIGLTSSSDKAVQRAFFHAGATAILSPPIDPEAVQLQVQAIHRASAPRPQPVHSVESGHFADLALLVLESMREPFVITDPDGKLIFSNVSAANLFGLHPEENLALLEQQVKELIPWATREGQASPDPRARWLARGSATLRRADYRIINTEVQVNALELDEVLLGYVLYFTALSDLERVSIGLSTGSRASGLALLLASSTLKLLPGGQLGMPSAPLRHVEALLDTEPFECELSAALTALLEIVDLLAPTGVTVKVDLQVNYRVRLKPSHLFQLLGHLLLVASAVAGEGEAVLVVAQDPRERGTLVCTIHGAARNPPFRSGYVAEVLQERILFPPTLDGDYGWASAQRLAQSYGATLTASRPQSGRVAIELRLPRAEVKPT